MGMKFYWAKIVAGALAIFCVGLGIRSVVKSTQHRVERVVESNDDLTIPLPFLPFNLEGAKVGNFRKLVIHRTGPEQVSGVDVSIRLPDPAVLDGFRSCHLTVDDPTRVNEHTSFRCVAMDSTMELFGNVLVQTRDSAGEWIQTATVPLALPRSVAKGIRGEAAQANASQLEADHFREIGDSMRVLGKALGAASSDSVREAIEERMQALRDEMEELQDNISEAARSRTERAASRVPEPPAAPRKP